MADFEFRFDPTYRRWAAPFGVRPSNAVVHVTDEQMDARFGPWRVRTPLANVAGTERTGPYTLARTAGPAHLSMADRGITFATNGDRGLCLELARPARVRLPVGHLSCPGITVTVADPEALAEALGHSSSR